MKEQDKQGWRNLWVFLRFSAFVLGSYEFLHWLLHDDFTPLHALLVVVSFASWLVVQLLSKCIEVLDDCRDQLKVIAQRHVAPDR
jgi:hypothetical protein